MRSLEHMIRDIMERATPFTGHGAVAPDGGPETDMNDQVTVGTYPTKHFEMSDKAQKLYSSLPKDTNSTEAEQSAINLDKILQIFKHASTRGHATDTDMQAVNDLAAKVRHHAMNINMVAQHDAILDDIFPHMTKLSQNAPERVIDPEDHQHPSDDARFDTPSKNYSTDKTQDRDVDNVKNFLIKRSINAQRKMKIIDND